MTEIILTTVDYMKLKLLVKNQITIESVVKPEPEITCYCRAHCQT